MCNDCKESIDSPHMHLTEDGLEELHRLETNQELWPDAFCLECHFYSHHDINNPEQEDYNHDIIFKVEEYKDGTKIENFGVGGGIYPMRVNNWKSRVVILGTKPLPDFRILRYL